MIRVLSKAHTLRWFSKTKIPFDFQLPSSSKSHLFSDKVYSDNGTDSNVQTFKIKRNGLRSKLIPKQKQYQDDFVIQSKAQALYDQKVKEELSKGEKTRRFYNYELVRGEDLIQDIPVDPYYEYKIADLQNMAKDHKQIYQSLINKDSTKSIKKRDHLKNIVDGYENSKHRYQKQEFFKYLERYPGSLKGPQPQDDPQAFMQYARKQMPANIMSQLSMNQNKDIMQRVDDSGSNPKCVHISDMMAEDRPEILSIQNIQENIDNDLQANQSTVMSRYENGIPILPNINFEEYHSYIAKIQLWWNFTEEYYRRNSEAHHQMLRFLINQASEGHIVNQDELIPIKPKTSSLYIYFRTLPKEIRDKPEIKTVYLGMEFNQPDYTYEQKEQALNKAAYLSLPLDKVSERLMDDLTFEKKKYLDPHLVDRIFNIHPQFTWDMTDFLEEVKEQKLRSMSTVKQKQEFFPEPPKRQMKSEAHLPNLPVDYYDNDDGFWDEHIEEKLQIYYDNQPLSNRDKKYFTH